jgi:hypothetical protein
MDATKLADAFESGSLSSNGFSHEQHVQVGWSLAHKYGAEDGLERFVAGIKGWLSAPGAPTPTTSP